MSLQIFFFAREMKNSENFQLIAKNIAFYEVEIHPNLDPSIDLTQHYKAYDHVTPVVNHIGRSKINYFFSLLLNPALRTASLAVLLICLNLSGPI